MLLQCQFTLLQFNDKSDIIQIVISYNYTV